MQNKKIRIILFFTLFFILFLCSNCFAYEEGDVVTFYNVFDTSISYKVTINETIPAGFSQLRYVWNGNTSSKINIYADSMSCFKENSSSNGSSSGIYTFDMLGTNSNKLYRWQLDPLTRYFLKFS